jgi:ATP-binding cassette subfamily F protein 3
MAGLKSTIDIAKKQLEIDVLNQKKEFDKLFKKAENKVAQCEKEISELEIEMQKMDDILVNPEEFKKVASDPKVFEKYNEIKLNLEKKMEEWEQLNEELETLKRVTK